MFDLDNFSELQERYGHFSGDLVLERVAGIVAPLKATGCVVGRLGSDEFGIAAPTGDPAWARATSEAVRSALAQYEWTGALEEESPERLTVSFGMALAPQDGRSPAELLKAAGNALLQQKVLGGDGARFASLVPEPVTDEPIPLPVNFQEWRGVMLRRAKTA